MTKEQFIIALSNMIHSPKGHAIESHFDSKLASLTITKHFASAGYKETATITIHDDFVNLKYDNGKRVEYCNCYYYSDLFKMFVTLYLFQKKGIICNYTNSFEYINEDTGKIEIDFWDMYLSFKRKAKESITLNRKHIRIFTECIYRYIFKKYKKAGWFKRYLFSF